MTTAYLGIDPGATGAAALIGPDGLALVEAYPGDVVAAADLLLARYARSQCSR